MELRGSGRNEGGAKETIQSAGDPPQQLASHFNESTLAHVEEEEDASLSPQRDEQTRKAGAESEQRTGAFNRSDLPTLESKE